MKEVRFLGIDDGHFIKKRKDKALVIGAITRASGYVEGILSTTVSIDGYDSTSKLAEMINNSRFKQQLRAVFIHGYTVAGFNIIDLELLHKKTGIPVITILRRKPDAAEVEAALQCFDKQKLLLFRKVKDLRTFKKIVYSVVGLRPHEAQDLIKTTTIRGNIPEPLRLAHIIASGVSRGESRGRI